MKHLQGGKYTSSHTTAIPEVYAVAHAAHRLICVSKISLGVILPLPNGPISIKFHDQGACLLAKVRGRSSLQEIRVYTSDKSATMLSMQTALC